MTGEKYQQYRETELKPFAETLQTEYYDAIDNICVKARAQSMKIKGIEKSEAQLRYVLSCENIISEIEKHIKDRKSTYIPYVHSLSEKVRDNHNCTNCTGTCKVNHDMHIIELTATNQEIKKVLSKLQLISLPLYSETIFPDEYRVLRSNMTLLETNLAELFFLENNYLLPKIAEAQKVINAGNK